MCGQKGQALLEFALSSFCLIAIAAGAAAIAQAEWQRTQCLRLAFETAHLARIGVSSMTAPTRLMREAGGWATAEPEAGGFRGVAVCGSHRESADLPTLEGGQW